MAEWRMHPPLGHEASTGSDHQRLTQRKPEQGFGRYVQLFTFRQNLNSACRACADSRPDRGTFTATSDQTDESADSRGRTDPTSGLTPSALANFRILCGRQRVRNAVDHDLRQFESQFGGPTHAGGTFHFDDTTPQIRTTRSNLKALEGNRFGQRRGERLSRFV